VVEVEYAAADLIKAAELLFDVPDELKWTCFKKFTRTSSNIAIVLLLIDELVEFNAAELDALVIIHM
jgi:hypothetical protein